MTVALIILGIYAAGSFFAVRATRLCFTTKMRFYDYFMAVVASWYCVAIISAVISFPFQKEGFRKAFFLGS